jgi:hypothetical protein
MPQAKPTAIYQLKITLRGSKPPIWRRIQVADNTTLWSLHWILQEAMGWTNSHLHQFVINGEYYSDPDMEIDEAQNEKKVRIGEVARGPKSRFTYEYDFGDDWLHEILVEKILPVDPGVNYPICLAGKRACPPEDVGGIWGYYQLLQVINDPNHNEHESMKQWVGGLFDPEEFDLENVNNRLRGLRK